MSAAAKMAAAVRLLVRTGRASIMPRYQPTNPFRRKEEVDAEEAAATVEAEG